MTLGSFGFKQGFQTTVCSCFCFHGRRNDMRNIRNESCGKSSLSIGKPGLAFCWWLIFAYILPSSLSAIRCGPFGGHWPEVNCILIPSGNGPSLTPSMILHCPKIRFNIGPALETFRNPLQVLHCGDAMESSEALASGGPECKLLVCLKLHDPGWFFKPERIA